MGVARAGNEWDRRVGRGCMGDPGLSSDVVVANVVEHAVIVNCECSCLVAHAAEDDEVVVPCVR